VSVNTKVPGLLEENCVVLAVRVERVAGGPETCFQK